MREPALPIPAPSLPEGEASVRLVDVDPAFRRAIPRDERDLAQRLLVVPRRRLSGPFAIPTEGHAPLGALVLDGVVVREARLADQVNAQLLGPGDILRPWSVAESSLPCPTRWEAAPGTVVAILDQRFATSARRWPALATVVHDRLADQLDAAAVRTAITGLRRVEQRLLALLWHLADRWGRVRPEGVLVALPLTHELLGRLVAAQRPTVTLAMKALAEDRLVTRTAAGTWLLAHGSIRSLGPRVDSDERQLRNGMMPDRASLPVASVDS